MDDLPLLELFTCLREAGLPLGISDYEAAIRSWNHLLTFMLQGLDLDIPFDTS